VAKYLIVNADDLGISVPTNLAIGRAFRQGIVTSASLMANMPAAEHAVERIIRLNPGLGVGMHLCLTSGRPVMAPDYLPLLVDAEGCFRHGFLGLLRLLRSPQRPEALDQISRELAAQAARIEKLGIEVDHVDSHQHVHMIPEVFSLVAPLAQARHAAIRIVDEPLGPVLGRPIRVMRSLTNAGLAKKLLLSRLAGTIRREHPELPGARIRFFGVLATGRMTAGAIRRIVRGLPEGVSEIALHPGSAISPEDPLACSAADRRFLSRPGRAAELAAVLDPAVRKELSRLGIALVRFHEAPEKLKPAAA
jgi:predicted glycoside hydrolase/deacetylase ChbG (UPF0249 family)